MFVENLKNRKKLLLLALACLAAFLALSAQIKIGSPIVRADNYIENYLFLERTPLRTDFFMFITILGGKMFVVVASLAILGLLFTQKKFGLFAGYSFALIGSFLTSEILKNAFERARPPLPLPVYLESSFSFPSGHAIGAAVLFGFTAILLYRMSKSGLSRFFAVSAPLFFILAVGTSRVYLGVHFASDVLAGFLVGSFWLSFGLLLVGPFERTSQKLLT